MRIAFVSMHTSPVAEPGAGDAGGMNVVVRALADVLSREGHQVDLITRRADSASPDVSDVQDGVRLLQLPAGPAKPLPKSEIDAHIDKFRDGFAQLEPYDVVHSHHWMSGVAALPVAREWGSAHIQSFHSVAAHPDSPLSDGEPPESPARIGGEVMVATQSDLVVAVSHAEAATVIGRCGADPQKVVIVQPGVNAKRFRPRTSGDALLDARLREGYVLFAARLQPLKGPDLAIGAVAAVAKEHRPQLVIAGDVSADFTEYAAELARLIEDADMASDVLMLGPQSRDNLAALLRGCRVALVPSHSETFGLIALEASASGVPVLGSAAGGLTTAVRNGETGLLTSSRDRERWGELLTQLITDDDLHSRLGKAGRAYAETLSWERAGQGVLDAYALAKARR